MSKSHRIHPPHGNKSRFRFVLALEDNTHTTMTGRILFDLEALIGLGGLLAIALAWDTLKSVFRLRGPEPRARA